MGIRDFELGNHVVLFGDGMSCQLVRRKKFVNDVGEMMCELIMKPQKKLQEIHNLEEGTDLDVHGFCRRTYHQRYVQVLESKTKRSRVLVLTNFNGEPTELSKQISPLISQLRNLERQNYTLDAAINTLHAEADLMYTRPTEALRLESEKILEGAKSQKNVGVDYSEEDA